MNKPTTVTITSHLEMVGFIKGNGTACRFVSMVSETVPKLKAGSPYKGVLKISRKRGMVNMNYNRAVCKRIAERMGVDLDRVEYEAGETWYKHLTTEEGKSLPLVVNKRTPDNGEFYLQYYPSKSENVYRMPNGDIIPEEKIKPWIPERPETFKPCVISIKVSNIKELRASGVIMKAEDLEEVESAFDKE